MGPKPVSAEERFWRFVDKTPTCWLWTGTKDRRGYGRLRIGSAKDGSRRKVNASRFSLELHSGQPLGELFALHHCDNPSCVNPTHLYAGTAADNGRDMADRKRAVGKHDQRGTKNPNYRHGRRVARLRDEMRGGA